MIDTILIIAALPIVGFLLGLGFGGAMLLLGWLVERRRSDG